MPELFEILDTDSNVLFKGDAIECLRFIADSDAPLGPYLITDNKIFVMDYSD